MFIANQNSHLADSKTPVHQVYFRWSILLSEPGTIRLYLAINKYTLERWSKHALKDPPPNDLNDQEPFEQRFAVDEGNKVREGGC